MTAQEQEEYNNQFQLGTMVEVRINGSPMYGLVRCKGKIPDKLGDEDIVGLELEEHIQQGTDGTFLGQRYYYCPVGRSFFVKVSNLKPDQRFKDVSALFESTKGRVFENTKRIHVGNLHASVKQEHLMQLFGLQNHPPSSCKCELVTDKKTGSSKGFAFVTAPEHIAFNLMVEWNGAEFRRRKLTVKEAYN